MLLPLLPGLFSCTRASSVRSLPLWKCPVPQIMGHVRKDLSARWVKITSVLHMVADYHQPKFKLRGVNKVWHS